MFEISSKKILTETIDNDTLVINLEVGHYFSFNGIASFAWGMLLRGVPTDSICSIISENLAVDGALVKPDIEGFANQLCQEGLLKPRTTAAAIDDSSPAPVIGVTAYSRPELRKFTDMEALLMADPIHEFPDESVS